MIRRITRDVKSANSFFVEFVPELSRVLEKSSDRVLSGRWLVAGCCTIFVENPDTFDSGRCPVSQRRNI